MDWGSLIMKNLPSIIGAGAEIAGTVGGAKAQQAGITASKEDLSTALSKSNEAAGNSYRRQCQPILGRCECTVGDWNCNTCYAI